MQLSSIRGAHTLASCAAVFITSALPAQQQSVRRTAVDVVPITTAVRAVAGSPRVDGLLDDPAWQASTPISQFTQVRPNDGTEPTERTEVWVTYDSDALYVGARLHDGDPGGVESRLGRRDAHLRRVRSQMFRCPSQ